MLIQSILLFATVSYAFIFRTPLSLYRLSTESLIDYASNSIPALTIVASTPMSIVQGSSHSTNYVYHNPQFYISIGIERENQQHSMGRPGEKILLLETITYSTILYKDVFLDENKSFSTVNYKKGDIIIVGLERKKEFPMEQCLKALQSTLKVLPNNDYIKAVMFVKLDEAGYCPPDLSVMFVEIGGDHREIIRIPRERDETVRLSDEEVEMFIRIFNRDLLV